MTEDSTLLIGLCIGLVAYFGFRIFYNGSKQLPLPPGPKGLPLLGNLQDLPPAGMLEAFHWLKHKDLYGAILRTTLIPSKLPLTLCDQAQLVPSQSWARPLLSSTMQIWPLTYWTSDRPIIRQGLHRFLRVKCKATHSNNIGSYLIVNPGSVGKTHLHCQDTMTVSELTARI